jgi:2-oxoglutarate ferredoxin oxidoreductase subunit gamma
MKHEESAGVLSRVPEAFIELNRKAFSMGYDRALAASA